MNSQKASEIISKENQPSDPLDDYSQGLFWGGGGAPPPASDFPFILYGVAPLPLPDLQCLQF